MLTKSMPTRRMVMWFTPAFAAGRSAAPCRQDCLLAAGEFLRGVSADKRKRRRFSLLERADGRRAGRAAKVLAGLGDARAVVRHDARAGAFRYGLHLVGDRRENTAQLGRLLRHLH